MPYLGRHHYERKSAVESKKWIETLVVNRNPSKIFNVTDGELFPPTQAYTTRSLKNLPKCLENWVIVPNAFPNHKHSRSDDPEFVEWRDFYFEVIAPFLSRFDSKLQFAEFVQSLDNIGSDGPHSADAQYFRKDIGPVMAEFWKAGLFFEAVADAEKSLSSLLSYGPGSMCSWAGEKDATLDQLHTKYPAKYDWKPRPNAALALPTDVEKPDKVLVDKGQAPCSLNLRKDVAKFAKKKMHYLKHGDRNKYSDRNKYLYKYGAPKISLRKLKKADQKVVRQLLRPYQFKDENALMRKPRYTARDLKQGRTPEDIVRNEEHDHTPLVMRLPPGDHPLM
ncbi:hypothetical protein K491DRAFT_716525 [Lophiostoma macrostomum CBS 122681]|uniref:Uncharacterized protein n=1 Tax=Lophiostoma macrostomum CBS 122681 TaxID=1314788 RepID=A0A6A6T665_9PLEO|nr:hypothetical protein K491DRAFT_716525 [Lophiostoma macrostomum CBS 122681]